MRWLTSRPPEPNPHDLDIARTAYADFIRAQLIGYAPKGAPALLEQLEVARSEPGFAGIMGIETQLATSLTDPQVERAYWIVRDRFNRISSARGADGYNRWAPASLREPVAPPTQSPLDSAMAAKIASLAELGEAMVALDQAQAAITGDPTPEQQQAVADRQSVVDAKRQAAEAAIKRVEALETEVAKAAAPAPNVPPTPEAAGAAAPAPNAPSTPEEASGEQNDEAEDAPSTPEAASDEQNDEAEDVPSIDVSALQANAADRESEMRRSVALENGDADDADVANDPPTDPASPQSGPDQ